MADNVAITAGTGTAIATDEVQVQTTNPLGHVQFVKLVDGTLNGTDAIPGTTASGLLVNTELPAAAALADGAANPTTPIVGAALLEFNGTTWDRGRSAVSATGNATSVATTWTITSMDKMATMAVVALTWTTATVIMEASVDGGTTWVALNLVSVTTGAITTSITAAGSWQCDVAGFSQVRARCSAFTTGTNTVAARLSPGTSLVSLENPIPAGTAIIGALTANQSVNVAQVNGVTLTTGTGVAGTGTQRVAVASDSSIVLATGAAAIGKLTANSGVIIGDVNVVSDIPGVGATNSGKARAATPGATDSGVSILCESLTTPTAVTTAQYHRPQLDAATGGLWVRPVQASFRIEVNSAGLTTATTAYASNDTAGTEMTFASAARNTGWGGVINTAILEDVALKVNLMSVELWLFKAASTPAADNAPADWLDANMNNLVGIITFDTGSWKTNASNAVNVQQGLNLGYGCSATSLFGSFVLRAIPTGNFFSAVTDLRVTLNMLRD